MANALAEISKARKALECAKSLDDVLHIRDQAKAVETYMKAAKKSLEAQNQAAEIKVRAERKAGELISKMEKKQGQRNDKPTSSQPETKSKIEQLESIGVSKPQAHRLEQMAAVPEEKFEELADAGTTNVGASVQRMRARLSGEGIMTIPPTVAIIAIVADRKGGIT